MKLIACVDAHWGLGLGQALLFHLRGDMERFKSLTMGCTVVMGRATLDSFPNGRPLPKRTNIVLTRDPSFTREGVTVCHDPAELSGLEGEIWLLGGASVYRQLLPLCDTAEITRVEATRPADKFLPDLDALPDWRLVWESETREENGLRYRFCRYEHCCV